MAVRYSNWLLLVKPLKSQVNDGWKDFHSAQAGNLPSRAGFCDHHHQEMRAIGLDGLN